MRWIQCSDIMPPDQVDIFLKYKNVNNYFVKNSGWYCEKENKIFCSDCVLKKEAFKNTEWLDESDSAHTPDNPFRAEVAKSVLAALLSREWSDMDLACEQAVQAADKFIKKLNQ